MLMAATAGELSRATAAVPLAVHKIVAAVIAEKFLRIIGLPSRRDFNSFQLGQVRDDVRSVLRVLQEKVHLRTRYQRRRVGQPAVQSDFTPDDAGGLQSLRVRIVGHYACLAS